MAAPYCDGAWLIAELMMPDGKEQPVQGLYNPKGQYKVVSVASETASVEVVKPDIGPASDFLLAAMSKEMDKKQLALAAAKQAQEDELSAQLQHRSAQVRCQALNGLQRGCDVRAVSQGLADADPSVQRAALGALAKVVERGDERVLSDLRNRGDTVGLEALAIVGVRGDAAAVATASARLTDAALEVRTAAFRAVRALALPSDREAVTALAACIGDARADVRDAAAAALREIVPKGDGFAAAAISEQLGAASAGARRAALATLARVAPAGNVMAAGAVAAKLTDEDRSVREAAVDAFGRIGAPGAMPSALLSHPRAAVRVAAVESVAAAGGMPGASLEDDDAAVRAAAARAVVAAGAVDEAATRLGHKYSDVRQAAARALGEIGGSKAKEALQKCVGEANVDVQEEIAAALEKIGA